MSKTDIIEQCMQINPQNGVSDWYNIDFLELRVGFPLRGNGSPFFQDDRGLGKKYVLEKDRKKGNKLTSIRTTGFAPYHQTNRASSISREVRTWIKSGSPCSMCGTTANIVPDHRDGNRQPIDNPNLSDYQPLCQHCNTVKREVCKRCNETSKRFDAKKLGYPISWTEGVEAFQPMNPRCRGCYWCSPREFRSKLWDIRLIKEE